MNLDACLICKVDIRQLLHDDPAGRYSAVCGSCGPYVLDRDVVNQLRNGRRLDALRMREWISSQYHPDNNPAPVVTQDVAVWLPDAGTLSGGGYNHDNG